MASTTKFELSIDCGNAAFDDNGTGCETARILRELADRIERSYNGILPDDYILRDDNGNRSGMARFYKGRSQD